MPDQDLTYDRPTYSSKQASFHKGIYNLPHSGDDAMTGGLIAGLLYFLGILIFGGIAFAYIRKRKYATMEKELAGEETQSKTARSKTSLIGFLISLLVALASAGTLIAGLVKVSDQADLAVDQINFLADGLAAGSEALQGSVQAATGFAQATSAHLSFGNFGCSPELGLPLVQLTIGQTVAATPDYFSQWLTVPQDGLDPLVKHARDVVDSVNDTTDARLIAIAGLSVITLSAILVLLGQYCAAYLGHRRTKVIRIGGRVSLFVGAIAVLAASGAFGIATTGLLTASEPCHDPDVKFPETIVEQPGLERQSLQYFVSCDDVSPVSDVLWQTQKYGGHASQFPLTTEETLCAPEIEGVFSASETMGKGNYAAGILTQAGAGIPEKLSCSHVNPLYVELAYDNICGDATAWIGAVWLSSLIFGLAAASLMLITYNTTWRRELANLNVDGAQADVVKETFDEDCTVQSVSSNSSLDSAERGDAELAPAM